MQQAALMFAKAIEELNLQRLTDVWRRLLVFYYAKVSVAYTQLSSTISYGVFFSLLDEKHHRKSLDTSLVFPTGHV